MRCVHADRIRLLDKRTPLMVVACTVLSLLALNSFALLRAVTQSYIYPEEFTSPYNMPVADEELVVGVEPVDLRLVHPNNIIPSSHDSSKEMPYRYVSNDIDQNLPVPVVWRVSDSSRSKAADMRVRAQQTHGRTGINGYKCECIYIYFSGRCGHYGG
jgi:hypothetical protein